MGRALAQSIALILSCSAIASTALPTAGGLFNRDMSPITQVAYIPLKGGLNMTDEKSHAGKLWQEALSTILEQKGVQNLFYNTEIENSTMMRLFVDWNSYEDNAVFAKSGGFKSLNKHLSSILAAAPEWQYHASFTPQPTSKYLSAPQAPCTELAAVYFTPNVTKAQVDSFMTNINNMTSQLKEKADGYIDHTWSWLRELGHLPNDTSVPAKVFLAAISWESYEKHKAFEKSPDFPPLIPLLTNNPGMLYAGNNHYNGIERTAQGH